MTTNELLYMNFREEPKAKETFQKVLSKIKWLAGKYEPEEITLEVLESLYNAVSVKYDVKIGHIMNAGDGSFTCMIKNMKSHAWVHTVFFTSFWECMAKVTIVLYAYNVKGEKFKDDSSKGGSRE